MPDPDPGPDELDPSTIPDPGERFDAGSFNEWLGLTVESTGDGTATISVEVEPFKRNIGGVLHGGVTATVIDVAAAIAIRSRLEAVGSGPPETMATTNLEVNYLRPATDTAYGTAEVERLGGSNAVCRVDVESTAPGGERKTVAVGTVTYRVRR